MGKPLSLIYPNDHVLMFYQLTIVEALITLEIKIHLNLIWRLINSMS